ncbi:MAG TPA: MTAP family purine nucleoside phosphorylase, partial [Methanomicrobiales archaeon]|nr:MTAP family purine nucleoside phosphorylase [Methanomicrobiales archaeon]
LLRHQRGLPPHRINYRANIAAMAIKGVDRMVSIGSAGALRREIPVGSLVIPTDYISMTDIPSIHNHAIEHVSPEMDLPLSRSLKDLIPEARLGGIYVQTRGPRIETRAEVQVLARIADIVGMTVASEATLARELNIPFAALCTIDNLAHGLGGEVLTYEHILEASRAHKDRTGEIVQRMVEALS